jgi:MOSC domain-containing protein YiiM
MGFTKAHLDATLLENLNAHLEQKHHFHQIGLELQVTGYCDPCWKEEQTLQAESLPEIADASHTHL